MRISDWSSDVCSSDLREMRLMLYMNPPGVGGMALNPGTVNGIPGYNEDEYANQLIAVFREFGERYGPRVAGYWFDSTFEATECYPNLPFDKINDAIKQDRKSTRLNSSH